MITVFNRSFSDDALKKIFESVWSKDMLHEKYRDKWNPSVPSTGQCYITSEVLYHLLKDEHSVKVKRMKWGGTTHWFLEVDGQILDLTSDQFDQPPDYDQATGTFFLTSSPSKRSQMLKKRLHSEITKKS